MSSNKDLFNVCEKSVYRYINAGLIRTIRGDMPRSYSMKPRKRKSLNDVPAITLFDALYGKDIPEKLGINLISPNEVRLLPELINK